MTSSHAYNRQQTPLPFHLYRAYDGAGSLLYVGISTSVERRSREHRMTKDWWPSVARVAATFIGPQVVARAAEAAATRDENPRYGYCIPDPERAARRLTAYMQDRGIDEAQLADQVGVDRMSVRSWLGKR